MDTDMTQNLPIATAALLAALRSVTCVANDAHLKARYSTDVLKPPAYSTFTPGPKGQSYVDPVFGTTIKRVTDKQEVVGFNGERAMFSQDDEYFICAVKPPKALRLFDGRTGDCIKDLRLALDDLTLVRWCYDPQMIVYTAGKKLMGFNVRTGIRISSEPMAKGVKE